MKIINNKLLHDNNFFQEYFSKKYNLNHLERDYFKYIDYENILFFESTEYKELSELTIKINEIFKKAYCFYFENFSNNLPEFSLFKKYFSDKYLNHFIWRYDVLLDLEGNHKFIELNANTPGLITDVYDISKLNKPNNLENISENLIEYIRNNFKKYEWKKIWILLPYSYEDEDFLVCADYKDIIWEVLDESNIIIWDITESNIIQDDFFILKWEKIDVLLSFFPLEFFLWDSDYMNSFFEIIKKWNLEILNPIESIVLQDKLIFSVIWEEIDRFTIEQQELIKKHIPFTTREFTEDSDNYIAKDRFWRIWRWVYDKLFYTNIDNKAKFIYQKKISSQILDENWNFVVLWLYTDMNELLTIIWRKQKEFITGEWNNEVILCYK